MDDAPRIRAGDREPMRPRTENRQTRGTFAAVSALYKGGSLSKMELAF